MTENASLPPLESGSVTNTPSIKSYPPGTKFSQSISEQGFRSDIPSAPLAHVTSDTIDQESQKGIGPSALEGTESPYLAKVFGFNTTEILQLGLRDSLASVDSFVLALVKERNWVDTTDSYNRVLSELKQNLGIDPSLQPLIALERLAKGVKLLRLQKMHRRRDQQIQKQITKLNNDIR